MTLYSAILSLVTGIGTGILYGLFFLLQKRRVLFSRESISEKRQFSSALLFSFARIITLALLWYYVLLSPSINFILLLTSFLGAFWLTIFTKRA